VVVGGLVGLAQFCSTIKVSQARMPAIPVAPIVAPALAASSCEICGRLMMGPPGGDVYIGAGAAGGSGMSIGGNCGGRLGTGGAGGSGTALWGGRPPIGMFSQSGLFRSCGL